MKNVADLKSFLEERVAELKEEIALLQGELEIYEKGLETVDAILGKESFTSAADMIKPKGEPKFKPVAGKVSEEKAEEKVEEVEEKVEEAEEEEEKKEFEIKDKMGKILGRVSVFGNTMSIVPEPDLIFSTKSPPFRSFFMGKIIERMENEDEQAIQSGKLAKAEKISVNVIKDDTDSIRNIIIQNFRKYDRLMDLVNTITWTFRTIHDEKSK